MKFPSTRTQILTAAAVLLMLGGVTAAFAYTTSQGQVGPNPTMSSTSSTSSVPPTATTTTSTSTTTTTSATQTATCMNSDQNCVPWCQTFYNLLLSPVTVPNAPTTYRYGTGHALLSLRGDAIYAQVQINKANPNTQYMITLNVDGSTHVLASMVTDQQGNGMVTAQVLLQPGTHSIFVQVFDTTTFSSSTLVLQSNSITVILPPVVTPMVICIPPPVSVGLNAQAG